MDEVRDVVHKVGIVRPRPLSESDGWFVMPSVIFDYKLVQIGNGGVFVSSLRHDVSTNSINVSH